MTKPLRGAAKAAHLRKLQREGSACVATPVTCESSDRLSNSQIDYLVQGAFSNGGWDEALSLLPSLIAIVLLVVATEYYVAGFVLWLLFGATWIRQHDRATARYRDWLENQSIEPIHAKTCQDSSETCK